MHCRHGGYLPKGAQRADSLSLAASQYLEQQNSNEAKCHDFFSEF